MKKDIIATLIIIVATIVLSLPLMVPGLFTIHDDQQIARLFLFDQALKGGQFPPRWVDQLGFGFGYPLFIFYPPLVYFLGEAFHLLGFSYIDSVKLVFSTSIVLSGLLMYAFAKTLWGRSAGLVSALFYMLLPYRALDIYVRGAMAESFSFVFIPLILLSFLNLAKTHRAKYLALSAISLALLMVTHNLIFLPFMLILPLYLLLLLIVFPQNKTSFIFLSAKSLILSACFSAFFWLPAIIEKKYTIVDSLLLVNLASYTIHFLDPVQLWNWPWGFGGSGTGLADGISFKIGKLHVLLALSSFILTAKFYFSSPKARRILREKNLITIGFFLLFIFSAFMSTFYSKIIWDLIRPLDYLQFPWRFLIFTGLFSSILAGAVIYYLKLPLLRLLSTLIIIPLLFVTNLKLFQPQAYRSDLTDELATAKDVINWQVSGTSFEYLPKGVPLYVGPLSTNLVDISRVDIKKDLVEVISGKTQIQKISYTPSKIEFLANTQEESKLQANIFNFPGWKVTLNGNPVSINDENRLKLITFDVPQGESKVKIEFIDTPLRQAANLLSLFSLTGVLLISINKWKKQQR